MPYLMLDEIRSRGKRRRRIINLSKRAVSVAILGGINGYIIYLWLLP